MIRNNITIIILAIGLFILGCSSNSTNPVTPINEENNLPGVTTSDSSQTGHELAGVWTINFDPISQDISMEPFRDAAYHYSALWHLIPPNCADCMGIHVNSWNPSSHVIDADVTLKNPYILIGYDVRGIVFTDELGHVLVNDDAWTDLFDIPGGEDINPFKAFAKDVPRHAFVPYAYNTANFQIYCPGPGDIHYAVDVSINNNCFEPYAIENFLQNELLEDIGSTADLTVDVYDWQNDVDVVKIAADVITGEEFSYFSHPSGSTWTLEITNNSGALNGYYTVLLIAESNTFSLYKYVRIRVGPKEGWVRTWGGTGADHAINSVTDDIGNIYVTGYFSDIVYFGGELAYESNGAGDVFLCKYNSDGEIQWVNVWGGSGPDTGTDIALGDMRHVYVTGQFEETVDFDPDEGIDEHTSMGSGDSYFSKFDTDGSFIYAKTWGGTSSNYGEGIVTDDFDNVFIAGSFIGTVDFDPGEGVVNLTSNGANDIYVSKFDSAGTFLWVGSIGGGSDDGGYAVCTDSAGDVYVTGQYPYYYYTHLSKWDGEGNYQWTKTWGGGHTNGGHEIAADDSDNIYVTGWFVYTVDFDPGTGTDSHSSNGERDAFVSKFDTDGNHYWAATWGGSGREFGMGVAFDDSDNVYVSGFFHNSVDFCPGPGSDIHDSAGGSDGYIIKLDSSGNYIIAQTWGGSGNDVGCGVTVYDENSLYVSGWFADVADFFPGAGIEEHESNGLDDCYLLKLNSNCGWD
jgi:hypothetical protein